MMKKAIIDIGTNSTRLLIAEKDENGWRKVNAELNFTRIGENIGAEQVIKQEALKRTADGVREYVQKAREAGCEKIIITATSAVRDAKNREEVCAYINEVCGEKIRVLKGEEEAYLSYRGAVGDNAEDTAVLDIGGGSTELVCPSEDILQSRSVAVGAVRLKERPELRERLDEILQGLLPEKNRKLKLLAVGGTATTLAALSLGMEDYDNEKVCRYPLKISEVDAWLEKLRVMSVEEIKALPGMPAKRADVFVYGVAILSRIMHLLRVDVVWAEDRDLMYALLEE